MGANRKTLGIKIESISEDLVVIFFFRLKINGKLTILMGVLVFEIFFVSLFQFMFVSCYERNGNNDNSKKKKRKI